MKSSTQLLSEAAEHFRADRYVEAKSLLTRVVTVERPEPQPLLLLALASEKLGDLDTSCDTLDRLLTIEPRIIRAWLMRGDLAARRQDRVKARDSYRRGIAEAERQAGLPPDLQALVIQARNWLEEDIRADRLRRELEAAQIDGSSASRRFQQSLDVMLEGKNIYPQRPNVYYFPELPHIQFFERDAFDWIGAVESRTEAIAAELAALMADADRFAPHIPADGDGSRRGGEMSGNQGWSSLHLWTGGAPHPENAARCPDTMAMLEAVPLPHFSRRNPSAPAVMFSMLRAGARIPPHTGSTNVRLICHLPLIVPPDCGFRVGNETRQWERGKLLIFDDTIEHEAWNNSDEDRIVLIFDIWRPELSAEERAAVTALFSRLEKIRN